MKTIHTPQYLEFRWTVSRGRDTFGYNICSLWIHDRKVASCSGGGYDMKGASLASWMMDTFQDQLRKLPANYGSGDKNKGFYGLSFYNAKTKKRQARYSKNVERASLDGACGFESMTRILNAIGYGLRTISYKTNTQIYELYRVSKKRQREVRERGY